MARRPAHTLRRATVVAALAGLLLAQALALWHAVAHAPTPWQSVAAERLDEPADRWGHHAGDARCQLVDQLLQGAAVGTVATLPPAGPLPSRPEAPACVSTARGITAHYQARAPPAA